MDIEGVSGYPLGIERDCSFARWHNYEPDVNAWFLRLTVCLGLAITSGV